LRTLGVRNRATPGGATATATATVAQPESSNLLIANKIREARRGWAAQQRAQPNDSRGATYDADSGRSRCAPGGDGWHLVDIPSWRPLTPEEVAEEQRRVAEEEPRRWWWKPRYLLADLERAGTDSADAVDQVRVEFAVDDEGR
jgi:hypothetical protein